MLDVVREGVNEEDKEEEGVRTTPEKEELVISRLPVPCSSVLS